MPEPSTSSTRPWPGKAHDFACAPDGALPAENMRLARYTPESRHGLVFGIKFVLAFGVAPLAVQLVATTTGRTGDFYWVYVVLAAFALAAVSAALLLPRDRGIFAPRPAGVE